MSTAPEHEQEVRTGRFSTRERYLAFLQNLPSTESLVAKRDEAAQALQKAQEQQANERQGWDWRWSTGKSLQSAQGELKWAQEQLEDGEERDRVQAGRPEGCWCLGLGGKQRVWLSDPDGEHVEIFEQTCPGCPEGAAEAERAQRSRKLIRERQTARRIEDHWGTAQIPMRFLGYRLETHPNAEANAALIRALTQPEWKDETEEDEQRSMQASEEWEGSWYLFGTYGCGKTGLAVGYAWERLNASSHTTILFRSLPDLLSELRDSYNRRNREDGPSESELIDRYTNVDLLVLDDLGAEQVTGTGWVEDRLYQIVGRRHGAMKSTVFTSNLTIQQIGEKVGERLAWRIVEMCGRDHIVEVKGQNLRHQKRR